MLIPSTPDWGANSVEDSSMHCKLACGHHASTTTYHQLSQYTAAVVSQCWGCPCVHAGPSAPHCCWPHMTPRLGRSCMPLRHQARQRASSARQWARGGRCGTWQVVKGLCGVVYTQAVPSCWHVIVRLGFSLLDYRAGVWMFSSLLLQVW